MPTQSTCMTLQFPSKMCTIVNRDRKLWWTVKSPPNTSAVMAVGPL